jgi:uncharacterized protein YjaZ
MDNNICGGPDSGAGISDSSVPLSASAVQQVKAVIMLGDPRFVSGLPYGVGTCTAGGVSHPIISYLTPLTIFSSMPALLASAVPMPTRSRYTVTLRIPSAVMEMTPTTTSNTSTFMAKTLWHL